MALSNAQQGIASLADSTRVSYELSRLRRFWSRNRWLGANNRYCQDVIDQLRIDVAPGGAFTHHQLASYIAASSVIHCMDGWSYAARAVEAELSGDTSAARHLAYYAELRAAMSVLAAQGIGAFKNVHIILKTDGQCAPLAAGGAHEFVWDALQHWAQQSTAADLVLRVIRPGGVELWRWLDHFSPAAGSNFRTILAKEWLLEWGLDLQQFAGDRDARNDSSYRPTTIGKRAGPSLDTSLDFIEHLWQAHEPSLSNPFRSIDRYLLRRSLTSFFRASDPQHRHPRRARADFGRLLKPVFHAIMPAPTNGDLSELQWRQFLTFRSPFGENLIFTEAEKRDAVSSPVHHIQVIARAVILLRVATGAVRLNLKNLPSQDVSLLAFWWRSIGETRGLWEGSTPPTQFTDLWIDIDSALSTLQSWRSAGGTTKKALLANAPDAVRTLSSCERVAMWGLGL
jgi:hypothetical protein